MSNNWFCSLVERSEKAEENRFIVSLVIVFGLVVGTSKKELIGIQGLQDPGRTDLTAAPDKVLIINKDQIINIYHLQNPPDCFHDCHLHLGANGSVPSFLLRLV